MTIKQKIAFVRSRYRTHTLAEMAAVIGKPKVTVFVWCKKAGVKPITEHTRKVQQIRGAKGRLTALQLARRLSCSHEHILRLCRENGIPTKPSPCGGFREGHKTGRRRVGRPKLEPAAPEVVKKVQRFPAVYSNSKSPYGIASAYLTQNGRA